MKFTLLTIFPQFFDSPLEQSLIKKAAENGTISVDLVDIRNFAKDKHKTVDDEPFGGGSGMVMKVEPLYDALNSVLKGDTSGSGKIVLTSAAGKRFNQKIATEFSLCDHLIIVCGRYKGVDERIHQFFDIEEISIGDYILNGGETAALAILESVFRLIPGGIGKIESALSDSFSEGILGPPVWTRPAEFKGIPVPDVMLQGDHARQERYRRWISLKRTMDVRPDLLRRADLSDSDRNMLEEVASGREFGS